MHKSCFNSLLKTLLIIYMTVACPVHGEGDNTPDWESLLEQILSDEDGEDAGWRNLYEDLCEIYDNPFNINTITKDQLEQLPFLTPQLTENILAYLYSYGPMKSLGELQLVEEMDYTTRQLLSHFVYVGDEEEKKGGSLWKNMWRYGKHEFITRLDIPLYERDGYKSYSDSILQRYPNRKYAGDPYYHSVRYKYSYSDHLAVGFVAEKDPGERFFTSDHKGYDFYSYYLMLQNIGCLKSLVVGNYRLNFGQGLVMNMDFRLGKSAALTSIDRLNKGIRKHSSTSEDNYLQGVASAFRFGKFTVTGFYSRRKQDATLKQDSTVSTEPFITSLKTDGYHRTPLEISKKNNICNTLYGSNITFIHRGVRIGLTAVHNHFNKLLKPSSEAYKKYYPQGREFTSGSVDYSYFHPRFTLAGETALSRGGGFATLQVLQWKPTRDYKFTFIQRYYSKDYQSLYASSFSEQSDVRNECGYYIGVDASPLDQLHISGYVDFVRFPYLRYQVSVPSSRCFDAMCQTVWTLNDHHTLTLKYRYKSKPKDFTLTNTKQKGVDPEVQHRLRLQWQYAPLKWLSMRTSADYTQIDFVTQQTPDRGYMVSEVVSFQPDKSFIQGSLSASFFHTDSYASRLYQYERGLLYAFSFPSFYYHGMHFSTLLRFNLGKHVTLMAKYGLTYYTNRESIGTSQQKIDGNCKQDIQLQLRVKI